MSPPYWPWPQAAQKRAPGQEAALVLAVSDAASPRASWGLNADLIADRDLGWLAAGTGSEGLPFFTLYAVADRTDAQQACFAFSEALRVAPPSISSKTGP